MNDGSIMAAGALDRRRVPKLSSLPGRAAKLGLLTFALSTAADAAMLVERGDVLRVLVLEDPDLGREAPVSVDGTIMLPHLDELEVAGQDLSTIRDRIETAFPDRGILQDPTVVVELAKYRPLYVGGTVVRPGAVDFEPGLTVRHALILAGGLATAADASEVDPEAIDELRTRLRFSSYQLLQNDSEIARLNAELGRVPEMDPDGIDRGLVPDEDADRIVTLDADLLGSRIAEWSADQEHRHNALALVEEEIRILQRQAELQQSEEQLQNEEIETARSLVDQGLMPLPQLKNLEREASRLSRDLLESQAFAARAQQERATREYELENAETEWRIDVQRDLRSALLERARLQSEIEVLTDRLQALGLQANAGGALVASVPRAVIQRLGSSGTETIEADLSTELRPGDVIEFSLVPSPQG